MVPERGCVSPELVYGQDREAERGDTTPFSSVRLGVSTGWTARRRVI
jgi:hypothetical protein